MKKNIYVDGFYGFNNLGDDYILESILHTLAKIPEVDKISILSKKNTYNSFQKKYRFSCIEKKRFPLSFLQKIQLIRKCDYYIIGGGGLFPSDKYILILFYYLSIMVAKLFHKKVCIYGVDIVKIKKKSTKRLWKKIIKNIDFLISRDKETKDALSFINQDLQRKIFASSDITFCLDDDINEVKRENNSILWALASPFSPEELQTENYKLRYKLLKKNIIDCILKYPYYEHEFLPFYYDNDISLIKEIVSEIPSSIKVKILEYDDSSNKRTLFKDRKLCICMRFHSVVFALYERVNFVSISYAPKIERLLKSVGLSNLFVMYGVRENDNYGVELDLDNSFETLVDYGLNNSNFDIINSAHEELIKLAKNAEEYIINWIIQ